MQQVNFDQWFSTTLKEELKIRNNNYRIIRRRVCWLIGQWTSMLKISLKISHEMILCYLQIYFLQILN